MAKLFGEKGFQFLMTCYLGLGRTTVQPAGEYERKSVGTESTFRDMSTKTELRDKLRHIAEELEKDMIRTQFKGRTLVLKIKLHTYEVLTRQVAPPTAVYLADDLYKYSLPMLSKLEKEIPGLTLRLMGLRLTQLVSLKREENDFFNVTKATTPSAMIAGNSTVSNDEWEVWPENEFEEAARLEKQDDMNEIAALSQEHEEQHRDRDAPLSRHGHMPNALLAKPPDADTGNKVEQWDCPVCGRSQPADDKVFNEHIDFCLSKQTIQTVVKETPSAQPQGMETETASSGRKKRSRPRKPGELSEATQQKKRLFFG